MPAQKYIKQGETAPNLAPLPEAASGSRAGESPRHLWAQWYALPKVPLRVRAETQHHRQAYHLDSLLSSAVLRAHSTWGLRDHEARVIPLPVALLGVVPVARKSRPWRLPVWACTPLVVGTGQTTEALCLGHAETVCSLLRELPDLDGHPCRWTVDELPLPEAEVLDVIRTARPLPGQAERFTPPYWFDWLAAGEAPRG